MKKISIILFLLVTAAMANAQFSSRGSIEYQKVTNIKMTFKLEYAEEMGDNPFMEEMLKKMPRTASKFYKMTFNKDQSTYFYDKDGPEKIPDFGGKDPASENIVIKNFKNNTMLAQREIYETNYLVKDSIPKYKWKILDEMRTIAGFNCRKAVTTIDDSVVVVAYYTEQIMVSSGPESFGGLPGMILGLAVPRLYTSWFATSVNTTEIPESQVKKLKKGKDITNKKLHEDLKSSMKEWGNYGTALIWKSLL